MSILGQMNPIHTLPDSYPSACLTVMTSPEAYAPANIAVQVIWVRLPPTLH